MRVDRRHPLLIVLAALLCALLAACTIPGAPQPRTPTSTPSASETPGPGEDCAFALNQGSDAKVELGADGNWEEVQKDIKKAERYVDGFWQRHWDQCFGETNYRAPEKRSIYTDDDPQSCDGTTMESDNAFYCADGHFVAYGRTLMRRSLDENIGTPWVYLVVAHEWGHAMQQLLSDGGYDGLVPNPLDAKHELQADCLAAAALWGSDYEGFLEWNSEDSVKIAEDLLRISDESPWTKVTPDGEVRTGGPLARIAAFQAGMNVDGVKNCFAAYR